MMAEVPESQNSAAFRTIKLMAIEQIMENQSDMIYHNLDFAKRISDNVRTICDADIIAPERVEEIIAAVWVYTEMYSRFNMTSASVSNYEKEFALYIRQHTPSKMKESGFTPEATKAIQDILINIYNSTLVEVSPALAVFKDALIMDVIGKNRKVRLENFYKEVILRDVEISIKKFYSTLVLDLLKYQSNTSFGKLHIQPNIAELILTLEKEQSKRERQNDVILKKEFEINENELKEHRKNLRTINGRDSRGIQTLFRTTSNNHYTLNQMVDQKANIMITVNSIILSILIGGIISTKLEDQRFIYIAILILSFASVLSIILAILAITPNRTQGSFTLDDTKNKNGNLLYFGNFHDMSFKDYEWVMLQKLNDSDFLYNSLIKDIYFLGKSLDKKYKFIRGSLGIFLVGLVSAFVITFIGLTCF